MDGLIELYVRVYWKDELNGFRIFLMIHDGFACRLQLDDLIVGVESLAHSLWASLALLKPSCILTDWLTRGTERGVVMDFESEGFDTAAISSPLCCFVLHP